MNKVKFLLLGIFAAIILLPSCKKGPNDPLISLKSRTARMAVDWKLTKIVGTESNISTLFGTITNIGTKVQYDGNTLIIATVTTTSGQPTTDTSIISYYSFEMKLNKLGHMTYMYTTEAVTATGTGSWNWGSSKKSKDMIELSLTGAAATDFTNIYQVDQLKSKEMVLKVITEESSNLEDLSQTITKEYTYTFEKQ